MAQPGKQSPMVEPGGEAPVAREWHCAAGLLDCVVVVSAPLPAEQFPLVGRMPAALLSWCPAQPAGSWLCMASSLVQAAGLLDCVVVVKRRPAQPVLQATCMALAHVCRPVIKVPCPARGLLALHGQLTLSGRASFLAGIVHQCWHSLYFLLMLPPHCRAAGTLRSRP